MALAVTATTVENITTVTGTVSGGVGGTTTATIFTNSPGNRERFRIKVIRLVWFTGTAGDVIALKDAAGNVVWESVDPTTGTPNFIDQTNLGDEFRNGLQITATITSTSNVKSFDLFLYHAVS